jgi:hypothetical protein
LPSRTTERGGSIYLDLLLEAAAPCALSANESGSTCN